MSSGKTLLRFILAIFLVGGLAPSVWAESMPSFSADMVSQGGGQSIRGKIYITQNKMRMEMAQATMIMRHDRHVSWTLMPNQRMYMEQPMDPTMVAQFGAMSPGETERVSLGTETVGGQPAEKFRVTYTVGGMTQTAFQWMGRQGIPLKVAATDGAWSVEYRNVRVGPQPDSLFEIPPGYQKFSVPSM